MKKRSGFFTNRRLGPGPKYFDEKNSWGFFTICENLLPISLATCSGSEPACERDQFFTNSEERGVVFSRLLRRFAGIFLKLLMMGYCQKNCPNFSTLLSMWRIPGNSPQIADRVETPQICLKNLVTVFHHFVENPSRFFTCYTA